MADLTPSTSNVIVPGMRLTGEAHARKIVDTWLETDPSTEEHRVNFHRKTDELDETYRN